MSNEWRRREIGKGCVAVIVSPLINDPLNSVYGEWIGIHHPATWGLMTSSNRHVRGEDAWCDKGRLEAVPYLIGVSCLFFSLPHQAVAVPVFP
jgi:hypothetical protein